MKVRDLIRKLEEFGGHMDVKVAVFGDDADGEDIIIYTDIDEEMTDVEEVDGKSVVVINTLEGL